MGEGLKDDPAHIKCTVLGPQAKEWPHPCISSGGLVKTESANTSMRGQPKRHVTGLR